MEKLSSIIADLTHLKPEVSSCNNSHCFRSPTGGLFEIYCKERYQFCCGKRAHNVIADSEYPLIDFYEIFMPMCNLGFGSTYSINSYDIIQYWNEAHEKGKEDITYWKRVREKMLIKNLIDEDFCNYKKPSMFIGTSSCDFKCDKECGRQVCQNSDLAKAPTIKIDPEEIIQRFNSNPITEAIIFGGLEPLYGSGLNHVGDFHSFSYYILELNKGTDVVVYTGYYPSEIHYSDFQFWHSMTNAIKGNLIFKFGRFIPDRPHRFDEVLGVELASNNQFAINLMEIEEEYAEDMWKRMVEIEKEFRKNDNNNSR